MSIINLKKQIMWVYAIGIFISVAIFMLVSNWENENTHKVFQSAVQDHASAIQTKLTETLRRISSLQFMVEHELNQEKNHLKKPAILYLYGKRLIVDQPELIRLAWVMPAAEKTSTKLNVINTIQGLHAADFPDQLENDQYLNKYIQQTASTYDRPIIQLALGMEDDDLQHNFYLIALIGNQMQEGTIFNGNILGAIITEWNITRLINTALSKQSVGGIDISIALKTADNKYHEIFYHPSRSRTADEMDVHTGIFDEQQFQLAGKTWVMKFEAAPAFLRAHPLIWAYQILVIGLLLTAACVFYIRRISIQSNNIEDEVKRRTDELLEKNKLLSLNQFIFNHSADGMITTDGDGKILTVNETTRGLINYAPGALIGTPLSSLLAEIATHENIYSTIKTAILKTGEWRGEILQKAEQSIPLSVRIRAAYSPIETSTIINQVIILTDISHQKADEERLQFLSLHDVLTGLPNRLALQQEFASRSSFALRSKTMLNILLMDLDGFKQANDVFGHNAGDHVLTTISERIKQVLRNSDILVRYGGDEFVALVSQDSGGDNRPELVAEKILNVVAQAITWEGNEIAIGISIGIAIFPSSGEDLDELIKHADEAMYHVKENGKNNYSLYDDNSADKKPV